MATTGPTNLLTRLTRDRVTYANLYFLSLKTHERGIGLLGLLLERGWCTTQRQTILKRTILTRVQDLRQVRSLLNYLSAESHTSAERNPNQILQSKPQPFDLSAALIMLLSWASALPKSRLENHALLSRANLSSPAPSLYSVDMCTFKFACIHINLWNLPSSRCIAVHQ